MQACTQLQVPQVIEYTPPPQFNVDTRSRPLLLIEISSIIVFTTHTILKNMQTTIVKPPLLLHVIKRRKVSFNDEEVGGGGGGRVECTLRHNLCTGISSSSYYNERFQLF